MIKQFSIWLAFLLSANLYSQVGINTETPKATLDVIGKPTGSLPHGMIAPRVSLSYLNTNESNYTSEQEGTIVYVNDINAVAANSTALVDNKGYYYFDGVKWVRFVIPEAITITIPTEPWRISETGEQATLNTQNIYQNAKVVVGKQGSGETTAQLDVTSSDKGFLVPRLSKVQRDQITSPATSLLIWNTDEQCYNFWKAGRWKSLCGDLGEAVIQISAADCSSATVNGTYKVGVTTNSVNYIEVTVQVLQPGTYIIDGQSNNGFFFQKSGTFTNAGTYTIQIPSTGTPSVAGSWGVPLTANGQSLSCTKQVTVNPATVSFTFDTSYCNTDVYSDSLLKGIASTGKTIKIRVNVTTAGIFSFTSNTVNGVLYSASNVNLPTGLQVVTLTANGSAPTASGNDVPFNVTGTGLSGAACNVLVDILETQATLVPNCTTATKGGVYRSKTATTSANYIDLPVNASTTGTWSATTNTVDGFSFSGNGNITTTGTQIVRLYATGTPASGGVKTFTITINGATCNVNVTVLVTTKKIMGIGSASGYGYNVSNNSPFKTMVTTAGNYGTAANSVVPVENLTIIDGGLPASSTALQTLITNIDPDIIIIGYYATGIANAASATVLKNFMSSGGAVILMTDPGQNTAAFWNEMLNTTVNINTNDGGAGTIHPFNTTNDTILNGPFGDIRGLAWGEDASTTTSLGTGIASLVDAYSTRSAGRITSFKHKTMNLIWAGDGGFMSGDYTAFATITPFRIDAAGKPVAETGYSSPVYNSVFLANAIAWAIYKTD